jgi:hypothetical protein
MPIAMDTTGFVQVGQGRWQHQVTQDNLSLSFDERPLTEPFWLENLAAARRKLARDYGAGGCLIEAEMIYVGGAPAMHQLVKLPHPQLTRGQIFVSNVFVAKTTCTASVIYFAAEAEAGLTGVREATLMARLGMPADWVRPHPYDPELQSNLPYLRADDAAWDPEFPDHPLTRARAWVRHLTQTATVDPGFAALPTYRANRAAR